MAMPNLPLKASKNGNTKTSLDSLLLCLTTAIMEKNPNIFLEFSLLQLVSAVSQFPHAP